MSLLCAESPNLIAVLEGFGIDILWHPARLMAMVRTMPIAYRVFARSEKRRRGKRLRSRLSTRGCRYS